MLPTDFTARIIEDGITAAIADYGADTEKGRGAVAGFAACRGKDPTVLGLLLQAARRRQNEAFRTEASDYWYWACYVAEIEWVCNCLSAAFRGVGLPLVPPTARGVQKAAQIMLDAPDALGTTGALAT